MANSTLTPSDVAGLIDGAQDGRPLAMTYFLDSNIEPTKMICAFLLKHRPGGFMTAMPNTPVVEALLQALTGEEVEQPLLYTAADIPCETSRRRAVGNVTAFLVDSPWSLLEYFRKAAFGRGSRLELIVIQAGTTAVRPISSEAGVVADSWVLSAMDDPSQSDAGLGEYVTGVSQGEGGAEDSELEADAEPTDIVASLRARIAELEGARVGEARLGAPRRSMPPAVEAPARPPARRGARDLFAPPAEDTGGGLSQADWIALREAAGAAPPRLAGHERADRAPADQTADNLLAEIDAGALTEDALLPGAGDSVLQRLLLAQTQMLAKLAGSQPKSPLEAALGTDAAKGEGNLTGRGSAARDAYVRLMKEHHTVALQIRKLAAEELGVSSEDPPSCLMRDYVERKAPLGDHRTLAMVATMAAFAWQEAREKKNTELEAWASKLLLFADQAGTEQGRTQLGWLLTGLPEPSWALMPRRRQGLRPFSRLCPSLWLSANIAFLKEMDWLGTRMSSSMPSTEPTKETPPSAEGEPVPKRQSRRPKKPKAIADTAAQ